MLRKFKLGEWVKLKGSNSSPEMEVIKYVSKKDPVFGSVNDDDYLVCVWYDNGVRKSKICHQNRLIKSIESHGLFNT